jgi:DNA-binding response OmpR family regulator
VDARILVVEDDASIAELIERNLQTAGFSTRRVAEGDLALGAVREFAPDLVVLDIMLPGWTVWRSLVGYASLPSCL